MPFGSIKFHPSSTYLVPSPNFWNATEHLVRTPDKNYTVANYKEFFHDIGYDVGYEMFKDTAHLNWELKAPGVEVHCIYGTDMPTADIWVYGSGQFPDTQPSAVYGQGDGTVNLRSLQGCLKWKNQQSQSVKEKVVKGNGGEHLELLKDAEVVQYIQDVLYGKV